MRLHADWRPLVGLTPDDTGTLVEFVLTRIVIEQAVIAHNADIKSN